MSTKPVPHHQVKVKINAWVDEDILPLVNALNGIGNVITIDSCQGYGDDPAYVYFTIPGSSQAKVLFADRFAQALHEIIQGRWFYSLRAAWSSESPMLQIVVRLPYIEKMAKVIEAITPQFTGSDKTEADPNELHLGSN